MIHAVNTNVVIYFGLVSMVIEDIDRMKIYYRCLWFYGIQDLNPNCNLVLQPVFFRQTQFCPFCTNQHAKSLG